MNSHRSSRLATAAAWALLSWCMLNHAHAAAFNVQDSNLQACIQTLMEDQALHRPQDVTQIKCHSKGIRSMAGLAQFKNLESLSLYNNNLAQLDIKLASFKKLKILNLARNNLTQLTLANLPSLTKLYVFDNDLKTLTLSNMEQLKILKTNNNKINQFSYTQTPLLEKIYIFNNLLEIINIYDLPHLQYMDCRQNPMPDALYDKMDKMNDITFLHDGNAEDW
jgi:Leucine-rich repeat (LRR) protein